MNRIFFLLLATFVLVGCQPKEDNANYDEIDGNITDEEVATRPLYESNEKPRELELRQIGYTSFPSFWNYYCWAEVSIDECLPELSENHLQLTENIQAYNSPIGYPITLYYETYFELPLPLPDKEELFLYKDGILTPVEIVDDNFYLPEEEGEYTYIYKATFNSEHIGVAYYMFKFRARYMTEEEIKKYHKGE